MNAGTTCKVYQYIFHGPVLMIIQHNIRLIAFTYFTQWYNFLLLSAKTHNFPEWLQLMITCACFVINFELQMSAISTMLDLISLTKSLTGDKGEVDEDEFEELSEDDMERKSSQGATVAVVIVPSLSPQNLWYLNNQTSFYKVSWNLLFTCIQGCVYCLKSHTCQCHQFM